MGSGPAPTAAARCLATNPWFPPVGSASWLARPNALASPSVRRLADGDWQLSGFPPNGFNVYLLGDVLVDASTRHAGRRILRQLEGHTVTAHALTHAHRDHQGASREVCQALGIPFWVSELDADAAENPDLIPERQPRNAMSTLAREALDGPRPSR